MSSITIIQEHDRITFAVDTALCLVGEDGKLYRYYNEKVQKVQQIGQDMVFVSGIDECVDKVRGYLQNFNRYGRHINTEILKVYLRKEFPPEKAKWKRDGFLDIGVTVLSIINGESILYSFSQENNFDPFVSKSKKQDIKLFVDGFDNKNIHNIALRYLKRVKNTRDYRNQDTFISIYQKGYSEAVGGYIQIYSMTWEGYVMLKEHKLDEKDLRYVYLQDQSAIQVKPCFSSHITASRITGGTISGTDIDGVNITGSTINGGTFNSSDTNGRLNIEGAYIQGYNAAGQLKLDIDANGNITGGDVSCTTLNGYTPITAGNIGQQSVAYASDAGDASLASSAFSLLSSSYTRSAHISVYDNFIPDYMGMYLGSSSNKWAGLYTDAGNIITSDQNSKNSIQSLDNKYIEFVKRIIPRIFKYNNGQSGRFHAGFIAQEVEAAMTECGITDMEFAGLIKAPVYSEKLYDEEGNELPEYDTTSEIIGYDYGLRYEEFIPLLLARINDQEERLSAIEMALAI